MRKPTKEQRRREEHLRRKQINRENQIIEGKNPDAVRSLTSALSKAPRKKSYAKGRSLSYLATKPEACAHCFLPITVGQRVHDGPDGTVHDRHVKPKRATVVCDRCFMTKPCECQED